MSWWNNNYLFRRNLNLSILDPIPANHPVELNLSSNLLPGYLNKVRSDLQDISIIYTYNNVATPIQFPLLTQCILIDDKIQIKFNTFEQLDTSNNTNYTLYYGFQNVPTHATPNFTDFDDWPISLPSVSPKVTYRLPNEEWHNGISTKVGAKATFVFSGTAVKLTAETGMSNGIAAIQIDDNPIVYVDFYRNGQTELSSFSPFTNLTSDYHTLRIVNTGNKNGSSSDSIIAIDSFQYMGYVLVQDLGEEVNSLLKWSVSTGGNTR